MGTLLRDYLQHWRGTSSTARRYLIGAVLMGFSQAVTWSLLARYLDARGLDKEQVGSVLAADATGKMIIALPAALWLARRPVRRTFMGSACLGGAAYLVMPWIASHRGLLVANFVAGMSMAVHYVMIAPFLFRHTRSAERASIFGLAEATRTLASVVGAFGGGMLVAVLMRAWLEPGASIARTNAAEADATGYAIMAAGASAILAAWIYGSMQEAPRPQPKVRVSLLSLLVQHRKLVARFAIPQGFVAAGAGICIPFLPLYFKDRFALGPDAWGQLFAVGQILMTFGLLLTPLVLARLGYVRSIVAIELASLPFFLLLAWTTSLPLAAFAFLMRGALMNSTHPIHKNLMMKGTPEGVREVQTGVNATLWGLGWVVGPQWSGWILEETQDNYALLMYATIACYVIAAGLTWTLLGPVERYALQEEEE